MTRQTVAIMQPYFWPYIGYWRLLAAVDTVVLLDDVAYKKGGWINRNRILAHDRPMWLTIPVCDASPHRRIDETSIAADDRWRRKSGMLLEHAYGRAPYRNDTLPLAIEQLNRAQGNLSDFLHQSILDLIGLLGIKVDVLRSRQIDPHTSLRGEQRVISLCEQLGASMCVNLPGGKSLYSRETFADKGIDLRFLPGLAERPCEDDGVRQGQHLSIIHLLATCSLPAVIKSVEDHGVEAS